MNFFSLWKESFFRLAKRPLTFVFAVLFLLTPLLGGIFFFSKEEKVQTTSFEEEKEALTAAWEKAKEDYEDLAEGEDLAQPRQKILFYETALRFEINVWSSDFLFEAASVYAEILREWEILNAYPKEETAERKAYLETLEPRLAEILKEKDLAAYLRFIKDKTESETQLSREEIKDVMEETKIRLSATFSSKMTPAKSVVVNKIRLLRQSLRENKNLFDPAYENAPLSKNDRKRMEALKESYLSSLREERFDPVPANEETVSFLEDSGRLLLLCFLLSLTPATEKEICEKKRFFPSLLALVSIATVGIFLFSASLFLSVFFFAKGSLLPAFCSIGSLFTLGFYPALLLRLVLSLISLAPWVILSLFPVKNEKIKKAKPLCIGFAVILTEILSVITRFGGGTKAFTPYLPFVHLDLRSAFFPRFPLNLAVSETPILSLILVLAFSSFLLFLLKRNMKTA